MVKFNMSGFDQIDYDIRSDKAFETRIQPFIEKQLEQLRACDEQRIAWARENLPPEYEVTYRFHDHTRRVASDMNAMTQTLGLPEHQRIALYWAMLAHDLGKSVMPIDMWDSVEKPTDAIKDKRREHTKIGVKLVRERLVFDHPFLDLVADMMMHHHEYMDGTGHYGLAAEQISGPVRLAAIIESFDGYTIPRAHFADRDTSVPGVLKRMNEEKASWFDPHLLKAFTEMKMSEYNPTHGKIYDTQRCDGPPGHD